MIAKLTGIFNGAFSALESVVDVARDEADNRASRFSVVLRQCRPLVGGQAGPLCTGLTEKPESHHDIAPSKG